MATTITREQQQALGFTDPTKFSRALAKIENAGGSLNQLASSAGVSQNDPVVPSIDVSNIGTPQATEAPSLNATVDTSQDILRQMQSVISTIGQGTQEGEASQQALEDLLLGTIKEAGQQTAETQRLQKEAGLPALQAQRRDITGQLSQLQASLTAGLTNEEGRVVPMGVITGRQAQLTKQALVKAQGLQAIDATLQGQIETAQAAIDSQMQLKYSEIETRLATIKEALSINESRMTRQERRQSEKVQAQINLLQGELQNKRADENTARSVVLQQLQNGGMPPSIANQILSQEDLSTDSLLRNYGAYLQDPNAMISLRLKNIDLQKADAELAALKNPPEGINPNLLKKLEGLSDGQRKDLTNANGTVKQINQLIDIINTTDDLQRLTPSTEEGRKFKRIALDVADKMARERTGAVVSDDEIKTFKTILGLSFGSQVLSDDKELVQNLNEFKNKHQQTVKLIDPTNEIVNFLATEAPVDNISSTEDDYVESVISGIPTLTDNPYGLYLNNI